MLNSDQIKVIGYLSDKYKLGLVIDGNRVLRAGVLLNPWQAEEVYTTYFPRARDEFINKLFLDYVNADSAPA